MSTIIDYNIENSNSEYTENNNINSCGSFTQTPYVGISPSLPNGIGMPPTRAPTFMSLDNNIRSHADCNSIPLLGPAAIVPMTGPILENFYVNETDRGEIAPNNILQLNANRQHDGSNFWRYADGAKTTTKETSEFAYSGNAQRQHDGSNFWRYADGAKTTTKETSEFAYSGNAQRQHDGTTWYRYIDEPKTTTKETTEFAYSGDIAPATYKADVSRYQYVGPDPEESDDDVDLDTGPEIDSNGNVIDKFQNIQYQGTNNRTNKPKQKRLKGLGSQALGGARRYAIRAATLVQDYMPGPGRSNILLDPDPAIGKVNYRQKTGINMNGPGTLLQTLPDGSRYQEYQVITAPRPSANKLFAMDDRQIASYQVSQLKNNPLSIYTNNAEGFIPPLFAYNEPDTYTSMTNVSNSQRKQQLDNQKVQDIGLHGLNVYPNNNNVNTQNNGFVGANNPVMNIMSGLGFSNNGYNPMLEQGSSRMQKEAQFSGKAYSGVFTDNQSPNPDTLWNSDVSVYGPNNTWIPWEYGFNGIENPLNNGQVCQGNPALSSITTDYVINRDLM